MITGHRQQQSIACVLLLIFGFAAQAMDRPAEDVRDAQSEVETFIGLVETVVSGDQLEMKLTTGQTIVVNLAGIEAPAETSPYASVSQQWLSSQLKGQLVSAECRVAVDNQYDCAVFPDDRQINLVSLYHGFSMCNGHGSLLHDADYYKQIEELAKTNRAGLWQLVADAEE